MKKAIYPMILICLFVAVVLIFGCATTNSPATPAETVVNDDILTDTESATEFDQDTATLDLSLEEYLATAEWNADVDLHFPKPNEFQLDNGLKVFVVERHDLPMVYARAQIRGGSIYDPPDKSGLAYLTGWVLTEGTENYSNDKIDSIMDRHGAMVTSVAYNESCIATLTCLAEDTGNLFTYFAEILSKAQFNEQNLEEARRYIAGDLMRTYDNHSDMAYRRFRKDVFEGHSYSKPRMGTIEGIQSCSRTDVLDFYHRFYTPDNAVLVVVGDISTGDVKKLCANHLKDWEPSNGQLPEIGTPKQINGRHIRIVDRDTVQAHILMGHIGINRTHPDRFRLEVLNRILGGGGLFSRLAMEVRVKRGLTYGIYSFFAEREFTGEFAIGTFTKLDTVGEAIGVTLNELDRIRNEPPNDQELREAKQGLIGSYPLRFEEYEGIAETLVHQNFYDLPMTDITRYGRYIQAVTSAEVMQTAREHIHPKDMVITIFGPVEKIKPQVEKFGEVEVVEAV